MNHFFMTSFIVLILILFFSKKQKEGFLNEYCQTYTDCTSCANASGCSWCSATKLCLDSTVLKSTDEKCNQINAINSSFRCKSDQTNPSNPSDSQLDSLFGLYRDKIKNNIPPPNVYTTNEVRLTKAKGSLSVGNPLKGTETNPSGRTVVTYSNPEFEPYSGDILYTENTEQVDREDGQAENIKFVIQF